MRSSFWVRIFLAFSRSLKHTVSSCSRKQSIKLKRHVVSSTKVGEYFNWHRYELVLHIHHGKVHHIFSLSEAKLKPVVTCSHAFPALGAYWKCSARVRSLCLYVGCGAINTSDSFSGVKQGQSSSSPGTKFLEYLTIIIYTYIYFLFLFLFFLHVRVIYPFRLLVEF